MTSRATDQGGRYVGAVGGLGKGKGEWELDEVVVDRGGVNVG